MKVELELGGMSCNHCKMAVDQAMQDVAGILEKHVEIGRAVLSTDDWEAVRPKLEEALEEEGYPIKAAHTVAE